MVKPKGGFQNVAKKELKSFTGMIRKNIRNPAIQLKH
jgi:hypothetical protein